MDEVYACGYCEKEFSLLEELSAHEDACDQSGLLVDSDSEDEGSSTQKQEEPLAVSNMMDLCKTVFEEDTDEDDPSAVDKINTSMEDGCNRCGKIGFSNKKTKDVHEKICSGLFVRQPKFKAWKSNGVYNCKEPGCTEKTSFQSEYGLRIHFYDSHLSEEEKIFECEYCDKRFGLRTMRNKHVKQMHEKRFSCDYCSRKFGAKDKLQNHMYTHTGEKPYKCGTCDYSSAKKFNLDQHKQSKHQG